MSDERYQLRGQGPVEMVHCAVSGTSTTTAREYMVGHPVAYAQVPDRLRSDLPPRKAGWRRLYPWWRCWPAGQLGSVCHFP